MTKLRATASKWLTLRTYKYNGLAGTSDDGQVYVGVLAQELEKVMPGMVTQRKGKLRANDNQDADIRVVDPNAFTYMLINAVNEQQENIERLEQRIATLERGRGASSSILGSGAGMGLAIGLVPLGLVALRRRKDSNATE